ncbi:MFS transporter [Ramlibacter sp. G-1-2-2]|uniref:MFS transporter n=1 Tax=Ramlibacter agri TaxID=2728837 RepID=A0A848H4D0_9BURK|nr:MFS transporter [Ramlibacter agri]NML44090.1 MFS transporter [Ramlibacter agri]
MQLSSVDARPAGAGGGYLFGPRAAWFAFAMTIALMVVDYLDRQVIVSLFPHMKADWGWSDAQLGGLVSVVSVTVALGALPIALFADRVSRVKSIAAMAGVWSLATISCMFTRNYSQLLAARAVVGMGEAGYGSVGAALIASHFPARMRGALMAGFFASASFGSVLGVMLGGVIAARWGWQAAFGVVGVPGLVLALLYLKVRDYRTVALAPALEQVTRSTRDTALHIARKLASSRTMLWVCVGAAAQLVVVSAVWTWMPSFFNRMHGFAPERASVLAACVVLAGAVGSVVWGMVVDRSGRHQPRRKLMVMAGLCLVAMSVLLAAFGWAGDAPQLQMILIVIGGFVMTCTVGPVSAIVIDVVHPGVRATGASVLALIQNLFGLAAGPVVAGLLSDHWGLQAALATTPFFAIPAALCFVLAARTYEADAARAGEQLEAAAAPGGLAAAGA